MKILKRTWADVDLDALAHNYRALRRHVPAGCKFLGVMKADAYGHGAVPISHALVELGAEYLAVSNLEEAVQLRRGGLQAPILMYGYTPPMYAAYMAELKLVQEVHSLEYALELSCALDGTSFDLSIHLKVDTGMTRIGFSSNEQGIEQMLHAARLPHLHVEGIFTHFSVSDSRKPEDMTYTRRQYDRFCGMIDGLNAGGVQPEIRHCCNSGGTLLHPEFAMDMIRPGIATYGINPSEDTCGVVDLKPLMSLYTTVGQIRDVPAGVDISYGRTFTTQSPIRLAVLSIGYADGLSRRLSGKVSFRLRGQLVPVVGRICMDLCMVDVTHVPDVKVGDKVTVFGEGLLCDTIAKQLDTIGYEVLCGINKRVPRIYLQNGKASEILQYIV